MSKLRPFQTLRESGGAGISCAVLELDDFTPRYSTGQEGERLRFWLALSGHTQVFPAHGSPYYSISGSSIATIPPGSVWEGSWRGRQTCMELEVSPAVLREFTGSEIIFPNGGQVNVVVDDHIRRGILALHRNLMSPSPAGDLYVGHIARSVASHYLKTYCACPGARPLREQKLGPGDLQRVLDLIETQLAAKPALDELAALTGLNTVNFCRRFKNSTGLPPYQYLLHARIERAKQALRRQQQPMSELALSLGFYDQSQFSNTFRRIVGMSPSDYLRSGPGTGDAQN